MLSKIKAICLFVIFILIGNTSLKAQVYDDFSDGDFLNNPTWSGDVSKFIVNSSKQLQMSGLAANDTAQLSTASDWLRGAEWRVWVRLAFSPSSNNLCRIYLASNSSNLRGPLNGYYIKMGEDGSLDAVELFEQTGNTHTKICRGTDARVIASNNLLGIRVRCSTSGQWELAVDPTGSQNYNVEATGNGTAHTVSSFMGVYNKYTSSNKDRFYFDDFYAGLPVQDETPPALSKIKIINASTLQVYFSEAVSTSALVTANYSINKGIGEPISIVPVSGDPTSVVLTLDAPISSGVVYTLSANAITDRVGNTSGLLEMTFTLINVPRYGIVFSEIMFDPDPVVALPNNEYVELYNKLSVPVDITGWKYKDITATSSSIIPSTIIPANGRIILCPKANQATMAVYGTAVGLDTWPSLNNDFDQIFLSDDKDSLIDYIYYQASWVTESFKKNGGWSIEIIDPNNNCNPVGNWIESKDSKGGTPGQLNSVNGVNRDTKNPQLNRVVITDSSTLQVVFSESLLGPNIKDVTKYSINNGAISIVGIQHVAPNYTRVNLTLASPLLLGTRYILKVDSLSDCAGNYLRNASLEFGLAEPADSGDLVINEILFDPRTNGGDYVEIYNRSNKIIDMKGFNLANGTDQGVIGSTYPITTESFLLMPKDYVVIAGDQKNVVNFYNTPSPGKVIGIGTMPSYNNDKGVVILHWGNGKITDWISYTDKWHNGLLDNLDGVSLERINPDRPTHDQFNWTSASKTVGYGTPTYRNSQFMQADSRDGEFIVDPEVFTPNGDGVDEVVQFRYKLPAGGFVASATIFDVSGNMVIQLMKSEIVSSEGVFTWTGATDDKTLARSGIYIVYFEVYNATGTVKKFKKPFVLSSLR